MSRNFLKWGGALLLLFVVFIGLILYENPARKETSPSVNHFFKRGEKGISYNFFLKNGFLFISSKQWGKSIYGIRLFRVRMNLKYGKFLISGSGKRGLLRKSAIKLDNFEGKICDSYLFKTKKLKISLEKAELKDVKAEDFVIKGNGLTFFHKKRASLNFENLCSILKSPIKPEKLRTLVKVQ